MNYTQFVERFPNKSKRVFFFTGQKFFVSEMIQQVQEWVSPNIDFDFHRIEVPTQDNLIDLLRITPVGEKTLVIATNIKGKFEQWNRAAEWVRKLPKTAYVIVTTEQEFETKNDFIQAFIQKGFFVDAKDLNQAEGELFDWVKKYLEPCDDGAVDELISHLGTNYSRIRQEIKKLRILSDNHLTASSVTKLLGLPEPRDIMDLLDAISASDKNAALTVCSRVSESSSGLAFVGLMEHRFRQLLLINYLKSKDLEFKDIVIRLKLHRFWAVQLFRVSGSFPITRCRKSLLLLSSMDKDLRRGADFDYLAPRFVVEVMNAV